VECGPKPRNFIQSQIMMLMKPNHITNAPRRIAALCLAMAGLPLAAHSEPAEATGPGIPGRWSAEKANAWYDRQPWPCGFN